MFSGDPADAGARQNDNEAEFEEILYHITHDVRASLRALRIVPDWIEDDLTDAGVAISPSVNEGLGMLRTHAARMDRMLVDLRTYSRIGRKHDATASVPLDTVLSRVVDDLAPGSGLAIHRDFEVGAMMAPPNEIQLLFSIFLGNVMKHCHGVARNVWFSARQDADDLVIEVADDGPGIDEAFRQRVFGLLETLRSRDDVEGSGMGLAIAAKIARHLGGEICVTGRQGGGCVFQVRTAAALIAGRAAPRRPRLVQI